MNWKEIKEKNPKAWELFDDSEYYGWHKNGNKLSVKANNAAQRVLYDFFDEQGLIIELFSNQESSLPRRFEEYSYEIINLHGVDCMSPGYYDLKTRIEAETAAFSKAFELLEKKLSQ